MAHQMPLSILLFQGRRMLKTWQPENLPQAVAANNVIEEGAGIIGVVDMEENKEGVEGVVTAVAGVRSRRWAVANGGRVQICSQLTTQLTKKSKSSRQTEAQ